MCRMVLGFTARTTTTMTMFFNEWEKVCDDGFGYYCKTAKGYEYLLKAPNNQIYKTRRGVRTFMLHCRQKTSGAKENNGGEENHPFISEDQRLLLVHNGHVTNYEKMRTWLIKRGHKFESEVDSEFLLHSFEEFIGNRRVCGKLVKAYIEWLNKNQVSGTINIIVLDRLTMEWFAYSDGSIEVMQPIASKDLFVGTNSVPFSGIPVFTFDLKSGFAIFGIRNKILSIEDVGKIGFAVSGYGYYSNGAYKSEEDDFWRVNGPRTGTGATTTTGVGTGYNYLGD